MTPDYLSLTQCSANQRLDYFYTDIFKIYIIYFLLSQQTKMCGNHQPSVVGGNKMTCPGLQLENRFLGPIPGPLNLNHWASEFLTKHYLD